MNENIPNKIQKSKILLNYANIKNKYALYSSVENDPIFKNIKKPLFCCGSITSVTNNFTNMSIDDIVSYFSWDPSEILFLSSNQIVKLRNELNKNLILVLPYASFAMKLLRFLKPKIGQNVFLSEIGAFTPLFAQVLNLSGANIFIIGSIENNLDFKNNSLKYINEIDLEKRSKDIEVDFFITLKNSIDSTKITNYKKKIILNDISIYDIGLEENDYIRGVKYPLAYIRWHYNNNLDYFIKIVEKKLINIDYMQFKYTSVHSIEELNRNIKNIKTSDIFLYEILGDIQ